VTHRQRTFARVANLWPGQDAGSLNKAFDFAPYLSGYMDGEGCFTVSISPRPKLLMGWEVRPSVSVSQNRDRAEVFLLAQRYFGCGSIRPDRSDKTLKWESRCLPDIIERVIPHFIKYPLLSSKQRDFELFADVCRRMTYGDHLRIDGLIDIVRLAGTMNPSGQRGYEPDRIIDRLSVMKA
jgi:hypothetical protein